MNSTGDKNKEIANLYLKLYSDCNKFTYIKKQNKEIDCNRYYDKYIDYSIRHYIVKNNEGNKL